MIKPYGDAFKLSEGWCEGMEVICTESYQSRFYKVGGAYTIVNVFGYGLAVKALSGGEPLTGTGAVFGLIPHKSLEDFM